MKFVLMASVLVGLSGCYLTTSPKRTVASVAQSLKKNDYEAYISMLTPRAQAELGSPRAFKKLQQLVLNAEGDADLASVELTRTGNYDSGMNTTHRVSIFLDSKFVAEAYVACFAKRTYRPVERCEKRKEKRRCETVWEPMLNTKCALDALNY